MPTKGIITPKQNMKSRRGRNSRSKEGSNVAIIATKTGAIQGSRK